MIIPFHKKNIDVHINSIQLNEYFYAIKLKYGVNNKYQLYFRTHIIYGKFIDNDIFEYNNVHNGIVQETGPYHCTLDNLLAHDNNQLYLYKKYDEIKKVNDIISAEFMSIPMKYRTKETIDEMIKKLDKKTF